MRTSLHYESSTGKATSELCWGQDLPSETSCEAACRHASSKNQCLGHCHQQGQDIASALSLQVLEHCIPSPMSSYRHHGIPICCFPQLSAAFHIRADQRQRIAFSC